MGHHGTVRTTSLPKPPLLLLISIALGLGSGGCARKGDPIPRPRISARPCLVRWESMRRMEVILPAQDTDGISLVGIEAVRVYHLPLGTARPSPSEVLSKGEVVQEQRRPDLPSPGRSFQMDLSTIGRPAGWIVVVAVRVGNVVGAPSETLPWLNTGL